MFSKVSSRAFPPFNNFFRRAAAAAAEQFRRAGAIRHQYHGIVRPPEHGDTALPYRGPRQQEVPVLRRYRSEDRPAASHCGDRPRQDSAFGPFHERCRQRAFGDAGRRLRQLFQHGGPLLPRDGAGRPALPAECQADPGLLYSRTQRFAGAALDRRQDQPASTTPESLAHFQQLNAATINLSPGDGVDPGRTRLPIYSRSRRARCRRATSSITPGRRANTSKNRAAF